MNNREKAIKVFLTLVFIFGISYVPVLWGSSNSAQVISGAPTSFYSALNVNETVREAQIKLEELGFYTGRNSGIFGFKTRNAVLNYQTSVNIPRTGILDTLTQETLFAPPPIQYIEFENTKYGNQFLDEWVEYVFGGTGQRTEVQGLLVNEEDVFSYNDYEVSTLHSLVSSDGAEYRIYNTSEKNLDDYLNLNVATGGYSFEDQSDSSKKILVVAYDSESPLREEYPLIGYTKEGNDELQNYVLYKYNQDQSSGYLNMSGTIFVASDYMFYSEGTNQTRVILAGDFGKYAVENISSDNLERLEGRNVTVRGFLLEGVNNQGYPTIVVNYFE